MSLALINRSQDLRNLRDEGYEVEIRKGYLIIHQIPYVTNSLSSEFGALVSELSETGGTTIKPNSHVAYFQGDAPCNKDGSPILQIEHSNNRTQLVDDLIVDRSFSNKPPNGYADYFEKMSMYAEIISAPAKSLDPSVSAKKHHPVKVSEEDSVFNYRDTNSSRSGIHTSSIKIEGLKIGIIGLGGTGSYILDLVAKTCVAQIHLFDADKFEQHNAFRAPGAASLEKLQEGLSKVEYLAKTYSKMHRGIIEHNYYIDESNLEHLMSLDFVFISMDVGSVKLSIVKFLEQEGISFVDTGIGVENVDDSLTGVVRATTSIEGHRNHIDRIDFSEAANDDYASNIQIAELNSLNAAMAVIKWKKLYKFYHDHQSELHSTYSINDNLLISNDCIS